MQQLRHLTTANTVRSGCQVILLNLVHTGHFVCRQDYMFKEASTVKHLDTSKHSISWALAHYTWVSQRAHYSTPLHFSAAPRPLPFKLLSLMKGCFGSPNCNYNSWAVARQVSFQPRDKRSLSLATSHNTQPRTGRLRGKTPSAIISSVTSPFPSLETNMFILQSLSKQTPGACFKSLLTTKMQMIIISGFVPREGKKRENWCNKASVGARQQRCYFAGQIRSEAFDSPGLISGSARKAHGEWCFVKGGTATLQVKATDYTKGQAVASPPDSKRSYTTSGWYSTTINFLYWTELRVIMSAYD